jgi:hypothetical protein
MTPFSKWLNRVNLDAKLYNSRKSVSYIGSLEGILANGTVESGREVIHTEDGGFTVYSKRRNRSLLHRVIAFHSAGTTEESQFQHELL